MKILLVCMEYEYGDPKRGRSYEYYNFFDSLVQLGHEVTIFDYMEEQRRLGRDGMNAALIALAANSRPDLALFSLFTDELDPNTVKSVGQYSRTLCFFHDDTWRVAYSRFWAPHFDFFTTPDVYGEARYARAGLHNAIYFPFGCNEHLYHPLDMPKEHDVSFVGAWHPYRAWLLGRLSRAGFKVAAFGYRWPAGPLSHEKMVEVFSSSKINLNISNSAAWDARYLLSSPRGMVNRIRSPKSVEQLKARHFEINGCGGFQLSYYVDGLEKHYDIGKEIAIYLDPDDLVRKVETYLSDEASTISIAKAGHSRTLSDHTFARRFDKVFLRMGLV